MNLFVIFVCLLSTFIKAERIISEDFQFLREVCGKKLASHLLDYSKLHEEILAHKKPQRYLISVPVEAGLADRLTGIVSQFWLAFFSKRAFQIGSYSRLPSFEYAYDYRFINWTRPPDLPQYTAKLMFTYNGTRGYQGDRSFNQSLVDINEFFPEYLINNDKRVEEVFKKMSFAHYPDESKAFPTKHTVFSSSNRGGIHYMFDNQNMAQKLKEVGLEKHSAFRCAYNFLFKDNAATVMITEPFYKAMMKHNSSSSNSSSSLMTGIGIRAGDDSFDPNRDALMPSSMYTRFTSCAQKIEQAHSNTSQLTGVKYASQPWYVMADSLHIRKMIADHYKHKVIVDAKTAYFHGDCVDKTYGGCDERHLRHSIVHAASQLRLFSLCNVHIISESGFPRLGAFLSKPPYQIYTNIEDCTRPADIDEVMHMGAGIRL